LRNQLKWVANLRGSDPTVTIITTEDTENFPNQKSEGRLTQPTHFCSVSSVVIRFEPADANKEFKMDWRLMLTTFGIIFLAEMGDKTQIAAMTMAATKKRPWEVFIGASLALVAVSGIGVIVGSLLSEYLPLDWIKRAAGLAFIVIGALILWGKF
jgi:putative Ca2+/H+ antiporter (TMEM165/GDT1 family)